VTTDNEFVAGLPLPLAHLSWLVGSWVGLGVGGEATKDAFRFAQEVAISCDGRPFLTHVARSWLVDDDGQRTKPTAVELGIWRPLPNNEVVLQLTHSYGYSETLTGKVEVTALNNAEITGARLTLRTSRVMRPDDTPVYRGSERLIGLVENNLLWRLDALFDNDQPVAHVSATLAKVQR